MVDAPVSGGVTRASMGTLTVSIIELCFYKVAVEGFVNWNLTEFMYLFQILASGADEALKAAGLVLSGTKDILFWWPGDIHFNCLQDFDK